MTNDVKSVGAKEGKSVYEGGVRDDEKKLIEVPTDFDQNKHKPLGQNDFAKQEAWLLHRAAVCQARADKNTAEAVKYREKAEHLRKFGTKAIGKKVTGLAGIKAKACKLVAELRADESMTEEALQETLAELGLTELVADAFEEGVKGEEVVAE